MQCLDNSDTCLLKGAIGIKARGAGEPPPEKSPKVPPRPLEVSANFARGDTICYWL
jgi:hypothetical protein